MDPTSAVRMDTLPAIGTFVAPGAFASVPYLWATLSTSDKLVAFLDHHEAIATASAILLWIVAGLLVESVGSYIEVYGIDRRRPDHKELLDAWWKYLRVAWKTEPVGQRYLRRMLVSFKFELNMCVAALLATPGIAVLYGNGIVGGWRAVVVGILLLIAARLFFRMARESAGVLAELRKQLLRGVGEPPFDASGNPRVII